MKSTLIVSATRSNSKTETELTKSLKEFTSLYGDYELDMSYDNTSGLPVVYNRYLTTKYFNRYSTILFVHDDVYIDDLKVFEKIDRQFSTGISVVGLAGGSKVKLKKPALWHLMTDKRSQSGSVVHPYGDSYIAATTFGPTPMRCVIMDGLFLAINTKLFKKSPVKFDTRFKFHHYDIDFCLQCNKHKHRLITEQINVIHKSPGLLNPNDASYLESEQKFINKYVKN